jgi:hypothetical protein
MILRGRSVEPVAGLPEVDSLRAENEVSHDELTIGIAILCPH